MSRETHDKLRRAQDLLRHSIPNGDPAAIFDRALTLLIGHLERTKCASTTRPRTARPSSSRSRHIRAAVRRDVWERDGGQCAFLGPRAAAPSAAFWSITMSCRMRTAGQPGEQRPASLPLMPMSA
jgi:hypothetical protein